MVQLLLQDDFSQSKQDTRLNIATDSTRIPTSNHPIKTK